MPKESYSVVIFYDDKDNIANIQIMLTMSAKQLVLGHKIGVENRSFKVYRLGALLAKCVSQQESGLTQLAPDSLQTAAHCLPDVVFVENAEPAVSG